MDPINRRAARQKPVSPRIRTGGTSRPTPRLIPQLIPRLALQWTVIATLAALTVIAGTLTTARVIDAWYNARSMVGTMLAFDTTGPATVGDWVRIIAQRADQMSGTCLLDLGVVRAGGGSLLVTGQTGRVLSAHWAGAHTTHDASDCGTEAELVLNRHDFDRLTDIALGIDLATATPGIGGFDSK
jgi:hypothetical protein